LNPWVFHGANVLVHALAACVVFLLLRRLEMPDVAALFGAALFAVHPVQVEPVGWTSGLKDVLCGLFSLIALWQYVEYVQRGKWHYWIAMAAFVWALLCKPSAMMVPAIAIAIDWVILRRPLRQVLWTSALWWPIAIAVAVV